MSWDNVAAAYAVNQEQILEQLKPAPVEGAYERQQRIKRWMLEASIGMTFLQWLHLSEEQMRARIARALEPHVRALEDTISDLQKRLDER